MWVKKSIRDRGTVFIFKVTALASQPETSLADFAVANDDKFEGVFGHRNRK